MTHVLGVVGSARVWGNSDLLVRQVLRGAQTEGASIALLRLTNLHLESCTGCMRCAIGEKPCQIADDMAWLIDTIQSADGLVLAAPTYFLGPAAIIKLVLDRLLMVTGRVGEESLPVRPSVTLVTAGLEDWRGVALPYLNALVAAFGFRPIESLTAIAPGPGEVLLNDSLMAQAHEAGRRLGRGELNPTPPGPNCCPICRCESFMLQGERVVCPICGLEASLGNEQGSWHLTFASIEGEEHRWTPAGLRKHMIDWVMATGPRFLAHREEIKARRSPYRQTPVEWLCPARSDGD